ncbi:hypothetical protein OWI77_07420 [Staphylococcus nepalensis]|uniref:hypothetical protein n=1 Tax=Staphylococcus nepalensis TaxID=214473 RepID=UPI00226FB4D6|nr:hypothetical protein [Staphylococcus nepalensis]MCY1038654.1 hypothetical protein [Staphylococcus nepalensis]
MKVKGANTIVVKRNAFAVALNFLRNDWGNIDFNYIDEDIVLAIEALYSLKLSIQRQIDKTEARNSQKTLNERRLLAINLGIKSMEKRI